MTQGIGASSGPGSREPSPTVSALRASIPCAMSAVGQLLVQRQKELLAAIEPINAELHGISRALAALGLTPRGIVRRRDPSSQRVTIASAIRLALKEGPSRADAAFQDRVSARYGRALARESIAPHLSRLRHAGEVYYSKGIWSLASAIETRSDETEGLSPKGESAVPQAGARGDGA